MNARKLIVHDAGTHFSLRASGGECFAITPIRECAEALAGRYNAHEELVSACRRLLACHDADRVYGCDPIEERCAVAAIRGCLARIGGDA